ncbi:Adenylate cyclase type 10 (Germ cell soluble adenylyl cyclase) (sAC) (Testicular soluble adenylyl cyclase), partial [Durusdinium trenchii]
LRVVALGKGDQGSVATLVADKKEAKWMKKHLESVVKKILDDVEVASVQDHSEYLDLDFSIDVMKAGKGREIVDVLAVPETSMKIADTMAIMRGIDTKVQVTCPAASRKLADLEVSVNWTAKRPTTGDMDCLCVIFAEEHLIYACTFSSLINKGATSATQSKDDYYHQEMAKSVARALDPGAPTENHCPMRIDLSALPREVTDMYFVVSADEGEELSSYASCSLSLVDLARDQELTKCEVPPPKAQSLVVCSLTRHDNGWVVLSVNAPVHLGGARRFEPILDTLAERQSRHLNWERRRDLLYLRTLHKCGRMARCSDAEFAVVMHKVMELPVATKRSFALFFARRSGLDCCVRMRARAHHARCATTGGSDACKWKTEGTKERVIRILPIAPKLNSATTHKGWVSCFGGIQVMLIFPDTHTLDLRRGTKERFLIDGILAGMICREDFHQAIQGKYGEYKPTKGFFEACVVFADASGFTALTEALAKQPHGAEEIGSCLNGFFGTLIDIITHYGGDVLKFSGDAVTILWKVLPGDSEETQEKARQRAVLSACSCCESLQRQAQSFGQTPVPEVTLTLHIGVGFGPLKLLQLGGLLDRWEFCAAGQPLEEVAIAEPLAKPGETVVSPSIQQILGSNDFFSFQVCPGAPEREDDGPSYALLRCEQLDVSSQSMTGQGRSRATLQRLERPLDAKVVQRYVPYAVRRKLKEQSEALVLGLEPEMRRVSVIFLSIRGLNPGGVGKDQDVERTQLVVQLLQQATYAFEGSVNKFLVDDKGMLLLCGFGLPPLNHYIDDPLRAVLAAARFCDTLAEEGLEGQCGVATGTVWCGTVGSTIRREYTVLGDTVNLSARLMAKTDRNTVLVDAETFRSCRSKLSFDCLGAIHVKG